MNQTIKKLKASLIVQLGLSYVILTSSLIINIIQVFSLLIRLYDKQLYKKINYYLSYIFYASKLIETLL